MVQGRVVLGQDLVEVGLDLGAGGAVSVTGVERVDLGPVDPRLGRHGHVGRHLVGRAGLDAHGPDRYPPTDLVDTYLQDPAGLVGIEGEPLATAPASQIDADAGIGHAVEVAP